MKKYTVNIQLLLGEFEKATTTIVTAKNRKEAMRLALEGECHESPIFNEEQDYCDDGSTGMAYEVISCELLPLEITQAIQTTIDYILHSEMGGRVDREDSWYSTYELLHELQEKAADEECLLSEKS